MADGLDLLMRAVALPTAWGTLVNGLDDLFIDVNYYARGIFREKKREITIEELRRGDEKRIAIVVPAWREANVIRQMLEHNLAIIDYRNYEFLVGTYQNDPETQREIDAVSASHPNVHKIVVPHDGPTNKADCLNWVYQGLRLVEERSGRRADILVTHDAEDLIHPLELRLFNHLIPEHDFVQTPVFPLELPAKQLVGGTYLDEFAEHHLKDMLVREAIGGLVPSAGVGSGFARDAFEEIALSHSQRAFNTASLTEDYEIGLKFRLDNKRVHFACRAIYVTKTVRHEDGREEKMRVPEYIATREYFPTGFGAAVRQRARWITGITMQTWEQMGWRGSAAVLYCLYRDRKALFTNYLTMVGYAVFFYCLARLLGGTVMGRPWRFDRIFPPGSTLWWLVMVNTLVLTWRSVMKFTSVERMYGLWQAALSLPRSFVANLVNIAATTRAIRLYAGHRLFGKAIGWQKTEHAFPSAAMQRAYRKKLGELLIERGVVSEADVTAALGLQRRTGTRLGAILRVSGVLSTAQLAGAMAEQLEMQVVEPDLVAVPIALLRLLSERAAEEMGVMPLGFQGAEAISVAVDGPPSSETRNRLEGLLRARVVFRFATVEAIRRARLRAYRRLAAEEPSVPRARLGEVLLARGLLTSAQLEAALEEHRETGARLGEVLLARGIVSPKALGEALSVQMEASEAVQFRALHPSDVDSAALARLGLGFCELHQLAPLLPRAGDKRGRRVAAAVPLHSTVRERLGVRFGAIPTMEISPGLDIRLALAVAARRAFPDGVCGGVGGLDGAELLAAERAGHVRGKASADLSDEARRAARSPIDHLFATGRIDATEAAGLRAASLGVESLASCPPEAEPLPDLARVAPDASVYLLSRQTHALVVGAVRPTPALAREVSSLFPDAAVAWQVLASTPASSAPTVNHA